MKLTKKKYLKLSSKILVDAKKTLLGKIQKKAMIIWRLDLTTLFKRILDHERLDD